MDSDGPPDSRAKVWTLRVTATKGRACRLINVYDIKAERGTTGEREGARKNRDTQRGP